MTTSFIDGTKMKLDFGARMNIPITKHELFSTPVYEDEVFISPSSAEIMKDEVLDYAYKETGISDLSIRLVRTLKNFMMK